jgi:hypothetical protein
MEFDGLEDTVSEISRIRLNDSYDNPHISPNIHDAFLLLIVIIILAITAGILVAFGIV